MSNVNTTINIADNAALNRDMEVEQRIAELHAMVERQKAELKALNAEKKASCRLKVSEKGAVSIYGLNGRYPTTLYRDQWQRLVREVISTGKLDAFIDANAALLKTKPSK